MKSKIRVIIANPPEEVNAVTWWRMYQPLRHLLSMHPDIELVFNPGRLVPSDFIFADILFAYRPCNPEHAPIIAQAKEYGCKILLDYDDNFLQIPFGHATWKKFMNAAPHVNQCIAMADEVWFSTESLKETYAKANQEYLSQVRRTQPGMMSMLGTPSMTVVPNAVLPSDLPEYANGNTKFALWAGSDLHYLDLNYAHSTGQYSQILGNVNAFQWIGYMPDWGTVEGAKCRIDYMTDWVPTHNYFSYLRSLKPSIIWKPLAKNRFNRDKSNIAWLAATAAGGICLSNMAGEPTWEHCTKELPKFDEYYIHLWQKSAEEIKQHYNLAAWNEVRHRQILKLVNG